MERIVLDASWTLGLLLREPEGEAAVLTAETVLAGAETLAPQIWRAEVVNGILHAVRRGRFSHNQVRPVLAEFARLPVSVEAEGFQPEVLFQLAAEQRISIYEVAYLELALRRGAGLVTLDRELQRAAQNTGVRLIG